jgi:hypothetical protein
MSPEGEESKIMLSEFQQKEVWEEWIASEVRSLYYADLSGHYLRFQSALTWSTIFLASGATAAVISDWIPKEYGWIKPTLTALTAGISYLTLVMQNQKRHTDCADLHFKWNRLAAEYKALWNDMYSEDAPSKLARLSEKAAEISKSGLSIGNKEKIMLKWENHVLQHHGVLAA